MKYEDEIQRIKAAMKDLIADGVEPILARHIALKVWRITTAYERLRENEEAFWRKEAKRPS